MYKKNFLQDLGLNQHTVPTIRKEVLHPPPPPGTPPAKNGVPGYGGGGSKSKNSLGDHFLAQNNDFTRGVTSDTTSWGMLHERPQKEGGGYTTPAPALD